MYAASDHAREKIAASGCIVLSVGLTWLGGVLADFVLIR